MCFKSRYPNLDLPREVIGQTMKMGLFAIRYWADRQLERYLIDYLKIHKIFLNCMGHDLTHCFLLSKYACLYLFPDMITGSLKDEVRHLSWHSNVHENWILYEH